MRRVFALCERLASSEIPLVIEGDPGTGKELVAKSIHDASGRSAGPFVVFDSTAAPHVGLEIALLGANGRAGAIQLAAGGTLLVEHVTRLPAALQAALARSIDVDAGAVSGAPSTRVMATTTAPLASEVAAGHLREDLYFRLAVATITLPPLSARGDDARLIAEHYWDRLDGTGEPLPDALIARCRTHLWPGNVRELIAEVARRAALGSLADELPHAVTDDENEERALRAAIEAMLQHERPYATARAIVLRELERCYVEKQLARHGGNVSRAAAASALARRSFQMMRSRSRG